MGGVEVAEAGDALVPRQLGGDGGEGRVGVPFGVPEVGVPALAGYASIVNPERKTARHANG